MKENHVPCTFTPVRPTPTNLSGYHDGALPRRSSLELSRLVCESTAFVSGVLRRFGVRDSDVDDVAQRVFLTFCRRIDNVRPGAERAFLHAIAMREAGHERRTYQRRREVADEGICHAATSSVRPDLLTLRKQAHLSAGAILDSMAEELRAVFVMFELQQKSAREIADVLNIPVGTAKSRLRRARSAFEAQALTFREAEVQ